jgi:hypothetical protein
MAGDWTSKGDIDSPRVKKAMAYGDKMAEIVNGTTDESWDALLPMIDKDRFVRRGNERTELDWQGYRGLLDQWLSHAGAYEKKLHRASEVGDVVYLDLDEKATAKDGSVSTLRSISIYEFDQADRIVGVDVIMGFHQPQG